MFNSELLKEYVCAVAMWEPLTHLLPAETNGSFPPPSHLLPCETTGCLSKGLRKAGDVLTQTDLFYACTKEGRTDILIFISTEPCIWKGKIEYQERTREVWKMNTGPPSHPFLGVGGKDTLIRTVKGPPPFVKAAEMKNFSLCSVSHRCH